MATRRKPAEDKVIKQDTGSALRWSPHVNGAGQSLKTIFCCWSGQTTGLLARFCLLKISLRDEFGQNWTYYIFLAWLSTNLCCCWIGSLDFLHLGHRKIKNIMIQLRGGECVGFIYIQKVSRLVTLSFHVADKRADNFRTFFTILLSSWWHQQSHDPVWHYLECRI